MAEFLQTTDQFSKLTPRENLKDEKCGILDGMESATNSLKECQERMESLLDKGEHGERERERGLNRGLNRGLERAGHVKSDNSDSQKELYQTDNNSLKEMLPVMKSTMSNVNERAQETLDILHKVQHNRKSVAEIKSELKTILDNAKSIEGLEDIVSGFDDILGEEPPRQPTPEIM